MYKITQNKFKNYDERRFGLPLIKLEDKYGGQSVITKDDGCYVLLNGSDEKEFSISSHWYPEAARALVTVVMIEGSSVLP